MTEMTKKRVGGLNFTTIAVKWPTYEKLMKKRQGLDTWDDVINKLLITDNASGVPDFTTRRFEG